jgi:hypothetical protein
VEEISREISQRGLHPRLLGTLTLYTDLILTSADRTFSCILTAKAALLAELTGTLVGPPLMEIETVAQAMAGREGDWPQDESSDLPVELQTELVHAALTDHYQRVLDEPIPALGNLSPRAAAKTAAGRRKVVDWLKHLENQSSSGRQPDDPMASYDFTWLWHDLGLEKLRR